MKSTRIGFVLFCLWACLATVKAMSATIETAGKARLAWLGHAAFVYTTTQDKTILIDPWFTNPKAPKNYVVSKKVDAVLVTHGHMDHVGEAFAICKKTGAVFVASYELTELAKKNGVKNIQPLNPSGSAVVAGIAVTAVQAVHSSSYQDKAGLHYAGAPLGFILQDASAPVLYHAGDTGVFGDMAQIAALYHPEIALLPIGGVFVMKPKEAAMAAKLLDVKTVVPMHFGTFPALTGNPDELRKAIGNSSPGVVVLNIGEEKAVDAIR